jgi:hypothetical protein
VEGYSPYANASGGREPLGYSTIRGITLFSLTHEICGADDLLASR